MRTNQLVCKDLGPDPRRGPGEKRRQASSDLPILRRCHRPDRSRLGSRSDDRPAKHPESESGRASENPSDGHAADRDRPRGAPPWPVRRQPLRWGRRRMRTGGSASPLGAVPNKSSRLTRVTPSGWKRSGSGSTSWGSSLTNDPSARSKLVCRAWMLRARPDRQEDLFDPHAGVEESGW